MDRDTFIKALELAQEYGDYVTIGGGEPTVHPLFWDFIGLAMRYSYDDNKPFLITNGKRTEDALALARLGRQGSIYVELSLDKYHEQIHDSVVRAFTPTNLYERDRDDRRGIRKTTTIVAIGRGKKLVDSEEALEADNCICDDIFVTPNGIIYACGCRKRTFGTIEDPEIPNWYARVDDRCSRSKGFKASEREFGAYARQTA